MYCSYAKHNQDGKGSVRRRDDDLGWRETRKIVLGTVGTSSVVSFRGVAGSSSVPPSSADPLWRRACRAAGAESARPIGQSKEMDDSDR
jgi:hypothetical protein